MLFKIAYKKQQGFTFFELIIVMGIISTLMVPALKKMSAIQISAERASVAQIIGSLKSALGLEVARLALKGQIKDVANLENTNPMSLLAQVPNNYVDDQNSDDATKEGNWYFDQNDKALIYNVIYDERFKSSLDGLPQIRHKIKLVYYDNNKNGQFDQNFDSIAGLDLIPLEKFEWLKTE